MAGEDLPGGVRSYARPFSLVRPPLDRQFRTAQRKAERSQRKAERRLEAALEEGEARAAAPAVNTAELARVWSSFGFRELRADLSPEAEEKLHRQLVRYMSGEDSPEVWHATLFALREARRAAEVPVGVRPRKWRQSFSSSDYW
jgi:hypothetical protein